MNGNKLQKHSEDTLLSPQEIQTIERKVNFEIASSHHNMIKVGSITNIVAGLFVIWTLYNQHSLTILLYWYLALVVLSVSDILWAKRYDARTLTYDKLLIWRKGFYVIFGILCLVWGSIGVLFISGELNNQIYIIAFLLAVLIGFSFSSITDFTLATVSILLLLFPTVAFRMYLGMQDIRLSGHDVHFHFGISISLLILGTFLLIVCFIGSRLVHKFFRLSFINVALSRKLEDMNTTLEKRVQERTIELEKSLKLVTYQATHDLLTDLPNQRLLFEYMEEFIKESIKTKTMFAVIFFSLNEIEKINDGFGHHVGDFVIKTIAQRLQERFVEAQKANTYTVTLSRKDVFVILLHPIFKLDEIEGKVEPLFSVLEEPIYTENQIIRVTASIGISIYPRNGNNIKTLLMNADAAMLRSRQYGGNYIHMYKSEINADISRQLELESNLHSALSKSEFLLHYQPFVDLQTGKICGMEALVRWVHPVMGLVPPDSFIPLAETNGIINPLGEWVLRTACFQTREWHRMGFTDLKIAVNLSAKQLQQKNIINIIDIILRESELEPQFLELELTETAAFQDDTIPILKQMNEMGLGLSIDDFGTGYSSLKNLKQFLISKLKIDKSFVKDIDTNNDSKTIVSNTIELAKKLNIYVLAEGVETKANVDFLKSHGCHYAQGYYFSPPVKAEVFTELLMNKKQFEV